MDAEDLSSATRNVTLCGTRVPHPYQELRGREDVISICICIICRPNACEPTPFREAHPQPVNESLDLSFSLYKSKSDRTSRPTNEQEWQTPPHQQLFPVFVASVAYPSCLNSHLIHTLLSLLALSFSYPNFRDSLPPSLSPAYPLISFLFRHPPIPEPRARTSAQLSVPWRKLPAERRAKHQPR